MIMHTSHLWKPSSQVVISIILVKKKTRQDVIFEYRFSKKMCKAGM